MDEIILSMLEQYQCITDDDFENALKQIMQQIALLGLWRAKFFEHAAFYGGTALRILYKLDRFSEDLDFSLLKSNPQFQLDGYLHAISSELEAFGFDTQINMKQKKSDTDIQSAFLKANTQQHLIRINAPDAIQQRCHSKKLLKIKLETDIEPPPHFNTETKPVLHPIPFWIRSYCLPDLFAGKISAVLCRQWQQRIKGRDWYDFLWFIQHHVPVHLEHLDKRLRAFGFYSDVRPLNESIVKKLLSKRIQTLNVQLAKEDISKFIKNPSRLDAWSRQLFLAAVNEMRFS